MKAIDFRNNTFWSLRGELEGLRRRTYSAWRQHGPGTTREIATLSGISLLTLRPRSTELLELGLLEIVSDVEGEPQRRAREGVYQVTPVERWNTWRAARVDSQLLLI